MIIKPLCGVRAAWKFGLSIGYMFPCTHQVTFYTGFTNNHPDYEMAGVYSDEGISDTNTKKREQFNKMIENCKAGKIDMIITKFISRFERNTLDCLNYVRLLKDSGIGVIFEKENIQTLDSKGEVLLSILSSLARSRGDSRGDRAEVAWYEGVSGFRDNLICLTGLRLSVRLNKAKM